MIDNSIVNQEVNIILLKRIIELLDTKEPPVESISVDNLDVISAALRNELSKVVKSITAIPDNKEILKELKSLQLAIKAIEVKPNVNVAAAQVTIPEIKLPTITIPDINVPQSNITVTVPDVIIPNIHIPQPIVNVQAPIVHVPPVDLEAIIQELHIGLEKLRTNNKSRPLAVRLTDGGDWIKELRTLNDTARNNTQFLSDVSYIKNHSGERINPSTEETALRILEELLLIQSGIPVTGSVTVTGDVTVTSGSITETSPTYIGDDSQVVTTSGTRVQLSTSTLPIKYVIITANEANTGTIWVGGQTIASGRGRPLVPLQSEKIDIDYLSKIYIDSTVSGDGVTFTYVSNEVTSTTGYLTDDDGNLILDDDGNPILGT